VNDDGGARPSLDANGFLRLGPDEMTAFVRSGKRLPASFRERLRIFVMLGRPRTNVPNLLAYALGFSYTGAAASWRTLVGALLACSIGFSANVHNAAVELEEDSRNLPGRVLLIAKFGHRSLMNCWRVLVTVMMLSAIALGGYFTIFMALAIVGLHQYSAPPVRSKGRPILGLWVFAQTVVFPFLFGWTTEPGRMLETLILSVVSRLNGEPHPPADAEWQSYRYLAMWFFMTLWFMAKGAFKNVPDFDGDLAAGVRTSATECGTRRRAAIVVTAATIVAYSTLAGNVLLGLERTRVLLALLWLAPVAANCVRLIRANDGASANTILRVDMWLSTGFLTTLLLLVAPTAPSVVMALAAALMLFGTDLFGLDSRRVADFKPDVMSRGAEVASSRL
jgi:4-hydroxybenzoate polyprenyltransferase